MSEQNSLKNDESIDIEFNMLSKVKVIKKTETPSIDINIKHENINDTYTWMLEKEDSSVNEGKFTVSTLKQIDSKNHNGNYIKFGFNIPLNLEYGYHNFKIFNQSNTKQHQEMRLIVVPEKCFIPEIVLKNEKISGPKILFSDLIFQNSDLDIKNIIKSLSDYELDIISLGSINRTCIDKNGINNALRPSHRMFFDTLFLNTDNILDFINDKDLKIKSQSREFQENNEEQDKADLTNFKTIIDNKLKRYKLLYESFKEHHIRNNTQKAQLFISFIENNGDKLHKLALFEALHDFLSKENDKYNIWSEWPDDYKNPTSEIILQFEKNNNELIEFYKFLLWQIDIQIKEAGQTSLRKKLGVGICTDFSFCIDNNAAEIWAYREYFYENAAIKIQPENSSEEIYCPALIPQKITQHAYSYFVDLIRPNMIYAGALNLLYFECILNTSSQMSVENAEKTFNLEYPIEDLLGIIALESQRNKCMIIAKSESLTGINKELLNKYGIFTEDIFEFEEISNEAQLKNYLKKLEEEYTRPVKEKSEVDFRSIAKIPSSTYRLQFNKDFKFNDAREIIPYLKKLGISHIYASPLLSTKPGSMHGYDVVNYDEINKEIGTFEEFEAFVNTLHTNGLGLILDIVPNHMAIGKENKWWMDVLENGQASSYSHYFDIDWNPIKKELKGKVLIPILGNHYGIILASGQIGFSFNAETGKLHVNYYENEFPLNPSSYPIILEYRIDILKARLGSTHKDFQEYLSVITMFKNLPKHNSTEYEKVNERNREKEIAFERLSSLCTDNYIIKGFIDENLIDFKCSSENDVLITRVHNLLEEQVYRLAFWRVSSDEINYRRFFDINGLAAICVEKPDVFINTHSFILNLIENNKIEGLRIDHPDGLLEPAEFYKKLQVEISKKTDTDFTPNNGKLLSSDKLPFYIVAEKILANDEQLEPNWAIHGTVGYDFLNSVSKLFIKSDNKNAFTDFYHKFIGKQLNVEEMIIECKKLIMNTSLAAELNVLSNYLNQISEMYLFSRDYTLNSLRNSLMELIACFPVYRSYISEEGVTKCQYNIKWAIGLAKKRSLATDVLIFDFIEKVLLLELEEDINSEKYQNILNFTLKFQQYTGPLMAKGVEDTFFYRYNRLISLNEVGGDSTKFGISIEEFHQQNLIRAEIMPNSMLCTATHDTKRSEDARCKINAISEFPQEWQNLVKRLHSINKSQNDKTNDSVVIDKNDEYLIYQSLIGIWSTPKINSENIQSLANRLERYILKAAREGKVHTSWLNINSEYEQALSDFVSKILNYPPGHSFWKYFLPFHNLIANAGYLNSISQCILKLTSPGVPDIYQGSEIYKFNLVDPDNRIPVDYKKTNEIFKLIQPLLNLNTNFNNSELFQKILLPIESGAIKLFYTTTILNFRNQNPDLFKISKYIPLKIEGQNANHFVAFARLLNNQALIVITPRLMHNIISHDNPMEINKEMIQGTTIEIPQDLKNFAWTDICTKQIIRFTIKEKTNLTDLFDILPVIILRGNKN